MAYDNNKPIGWLNANDRYNFTAVPYSKTDSSKKIGSVMCFVIEKDYRRKGVASMLLNTAIEHFAQKGLDYAEAYPVSNVEGDDLLQLLKFSLELANDEIFWVKPNGDIFYANQSACDKLGFGKGELIGIPFWQIAPEFSATNWPNFWLQLQERNHVEFESHHQDKNQTRTFSCA